MRTSLIRLPLLAAFVLVCTTACVDQTPTAPKTVSATLESAHLAPPLAALIAAPCTVTLSPTQNSVAAGGGTLELTARFLNCTPTPSITSSADWLRLTISGSGTSRTVRATIGPNTSSQQRNADITVRNSAQTALATSLVVQAGVPSVLPSIAPSSVSLSSAGHAIALDVQCASCSWTLAASSSWIRLYTTRGTGSVRIAGYVDANVSFARSGVITLVASDGRVAATVPVSQQGVSPTPTVDITPATIQISRATQTVAFEVRTTSCYTISGMPSWFRLYGSTSRCGNSRVEFSSDYNTGRTRSVALRFGAATVTVSQLGSI